MASISFVRGKWRALVRRKPHKPVSASFDRKVDAERWARRIEGDIEDGAFTQPATATIASLIGRYIEEHPRLRRTKLHALRQLAKSQLGKETLKTLTAAKLVHYGKSRRVSGPTLANDLSFLSVVLRHARHIWGLPSPDHIKPASYVLRSAGLLDKSTERKRRPTEDEITSIKAWFAEHSKLPMADIIDFAVLSAMRLSEVTGLLWCDYNARDRTILIRERKHPTKKTTNDQVVPLLVKAQKIIERQPRAGDRIFPVNSKTLSTSWWRARIALGIEDLRFHDLRHEGTSRLFEMGYAIHEAAMFTGHEDWRHLKRYAQISPHTLRRLE